MLGIRPPNGSRVPGSWCRPLGTTEESGDLSDSRVRTHRGRMTCRESAQEREYTERIACGPCVLGPERFSWMHVLAWSLQDVQSTTRSRDCSVRLVPMGRAVYRRDSRVIRFQCSRRSPNARCDKMAEMNRSVSCNELHHLWKCLPTLQEISHDRAGGSRSAGPGT